jgi:hypothetical protein
MHKEQTSSEAEEAAHRDTASASIQQPAGLAFIKELIARIQGSAQLCERSGTDGGPCMSLVNVTEGSSAGYLRLWAATDDSLLDRLVHFRLQSGPVDTQLLFLMGRSDTPMPHFHGQVVQFGADACVYNADIMPRLDPVDHPEYFTEVFGPVTKAYWKAINDPNNICSLAPANPAIAVYLSPWSIATGRPTNFAELQRVKPNLLAYLDQCLALARGLKYRGPPPQELRARDRRHMASFQSDQLDPRAWKGVYRVIGETAGHRVKDIFSTPLR